MASLNNVEIDVSGRAWYSVCHQVVLAFLKFRKDCSTFLCLSWCPSRSSIGWNRSSVKPEESQKLPLKPVAVLNV
uniref:Uncharacterized protein n=1 Tax=Panagrellus redivivus TaxID=6233 RepID=A0A7E5A211_PANRE